MSLRKHAEQMRDLYANEIAAAVYEGREPSPSQLASWAQYQAAANAEDIDEALRDLHANPE